ncbi:hypothetical protein GY507_002220, partial [Escherichia coli]|nr:hypothetical protein [Escherichia coli]
KHFFIAYFTMNIYYDLSSNSAWLVTHGLDLRNFICKGKNYCLFVLPWR